MAKRYNSNDNRILKIISILLVVVLVAVICFIIFKQLFGEKPPVTLPATFDQASTTEVIEDTTTATQKATEKKPEQGVISVTQTATEKVVLPSEGEQEAKYFSGIYTPYRVVDTMAEEYEDKEVTLREAFGDAYSGGLIAFYKDGTFKDTVTTSSANSGSYRVSGEMIVATYSNDMNMEITVTGWSGDRPAEFMIAYPGGYHVYFGL